MVSYGPWQQDPDLLQFNTLNQFSGNDPVDGLPVFDYGASSVMNESGYQDPVFPLNREIVKAAVAAASPIGPAGDGGPGSAPMWGTQYSWNYLLSHPEWDTFWGAASTHRAFRVVPGTFPYSPVSEGFWEPGAIGIDYETQPYDPGNPWASGLGVTLTRGISSTTTQLGGRWSDSGDPAVVPAASSAIMLQVVGAEVPQQIGSVPPPLTAGFAIDQHVALGAPIDLTGYSGFLESGGWIWTRQPVIPDSVTDPAPYSSGTLEYGWGFEYLRIDSVVRPPLWRWVFDTEPYRRIFPRDDGLAGGTPRTWPPSKSVQAGNRTSGGYL